MDAVYRRSWRRTKIRLGLALAAVTTAGLAAGGLAIASQGATGTHGSATVIKPAGAPNGNLNGTMQDRPVCQPHCPETYTDNNTGPH